MPTSNSTLLVLSPPRWSTRGASRASAILSICGQSTAHSRWRRLMTHNSSGSKYWRRLPFPLTHSPRQSDDSTPCWMLPTTSSRAKSLHFSRLPAGEICLQYPFGMRSHSLLPGSLVFCPTRSSLTSLLRTFSLTLRTSRQIVLGMGSRICPCVLTSLPNLLSTRCEGQ